jgi:hypothetical protein
VLVVTLAAAVLVVTVLLVAVVVLVAAVVEIKGLSAEGVEEVCGWRVSLKFERLHSKGEEEEEEEEEEGN